MMKESCKSYVLETKSEIETAFPEKFPSVVLSFPKGSDGSHFVLAPLKMRMNKSPMRSNICIHEHCIELGIILLCTANF